MRLPVLTDHQARWWEPSRPRLRAFSVAARTSRHAVLNPDKLAYLFVGIALQPRATATVRVDKAQRKLSLSGSTVLEPELLPARAAGQHPVRRARRGEPGSTNIGVKRSDAVGDQFVRTNGPVTIPVNSEASVAANARDGISPLTVRVVGVGIDESYPMSPE